MAVLHCRVTPNAKKNEILGWEKDDLGREVLRVKLNAPPVDGKANQQLLKFLSQVLETPKSRLAIERGEKSRVKTIAIDNLDDEEVRQRLSP